METWNLKKKEDILPLTSQTEMSSLNWKHVTFGGIYLLLFSINVELLF